MSLFPWISSFLVAWTMLSILASERASGLREIERKMKQEEANAKAAAATEEAAKAKEAAASPDAAKNPSSAAPAPSAPPPAQPPPAGNPAKKPAG
jgi:hypothetical protein